jgi:molecular chaperone DnaK (HSP70)
LPLRLGIDFGTTRTVVAFADRGNYPVVTFLDESGDPVEAFPSVVAENAGKLCFGFEAVAKSSDPSWTVVRSFKRLLGGPHVSATSSVQIGSTRIALSDLLTQFLSALRTAIATRSNVAAAASRVIAAPANAHSAQRFLSLDGFRRAGFDVLGLLNEPSAAGFEYTHRFRNTLTSRRDHVVVYDIGGGTFDVSLVQMNGVHHEVVGTSGINRLGGDDFDDVLARLALAKVDVEPGAVSQRSIRLLLDHCRELKERLNPSTRRINVDLSSSLGDEAPLAELSIDVGEYYQECAPLIARTIEAMLPLVQGADAAQAPEGPEPAVEPVALASEIAGIYVVGGASALPAVARELRERFGKRVHRSPYPSAAAAIGLAIAADESSPLKLSDRLSRVFGVFREAQGGAEVTFDPIFGRDVPLPTAAGASTVIHRVYRAAHNVGHFRYVECSDVDVSGNPRGDMASFADVYFPFDTKLRERKAELAQVSVQRFDDGGPLIRESYAVDGHGIVEVTIANLDDHYERSYRLAPLAG